MRWQAIVKPSHLLAAIVLSSVFNTVAAGLVLPPLVVDTQQSADNEQTRPCRYTGDFKQERHIKELDKPLTSTGSFMFSCNKGLLWEVRKPIAESRVYSTETLNFRIRKKARVTQLFSVVESRTAMLLLNFLGGDTTALSKDFDLISDDNSPGKLLLLPKSKSVRKRLTQLVVQQQDDTIQITIQAPDTGDIVISIDNIASFEQGELSTCRQFSQQPEPNCRVLVRPADFVQPHLKQTQ